MVGYNITAMNNVSILLEGVCDNFIDSRSMITASFYKILVDFDETKGIFDDAFFILFSLAVMNEKNYFKYSDKGCALIFKKSVTHKMNRALYGQTSTRLRLKRESEMPEWIIAAIEEVGKGSLFKAVATMMIQANKDLQDILPSFDKMQYLINKTSLFNGSKFIGFKEIEYACDSYATGQV